MSIHIRSGRRSAKRPQGPNVLDLRRASKGHPFQEQKHRGREPKETRGGFVRPVRARLGLRLPSFSLRLSASGKRGLFQFGFLAGFILFVFVTGFLVFQVREVRGKVLGIATEAYGSLESAQKNLLALRFAEAGKDFEDAEATFIAAANAMPVSEQVLRILAGLPTGDTVESAYHLLAAGRVLSRAGAAASGILAPLAGEGIRFEQEGFPTVTVSEQLVSPEWLAVQRDVSEGFTHLTKVHAENIPEQFQEEFAALADALPQLTAAVQNIDDAQALLRYFLGFDGRKEFAVWFQNTTELRATGGFLGSFAVIAADRGKLSVIDVPGKGPYSLNDFIARKIVPPRPLQLINKHWQVQDANWWPDFPTSAEKFNAFYVLARGFPLDGVMAITPKFVVDLLEIAGPVTLDAYEVSVTPKNFIAITQEKASRDYNLAANQPKKFIADLLPLLFSRVLALSSSSIPELGGILADSLASRDLQLYSEDQNVQERIRAMHWSGEILEAPDDGLFVVGTNIGGGKTDDVVSTDLDLTTRIDDEGRIEHTLSITRTHNGDPQDPIKGIKNMSYFRVYVPRGSTFLSAEGFTAIDRNLIQHPDADAVEDDMLKEVSTAVRIDEASGTRMYEEFGRQVFGHWIGVEAGKTETASLTYTLPRRLTEETESYSLFVQRQAGAGKTAFSHTVTIPDGWKFSWKSTDEQVLELGPSSIEFSTDLTSDSFFGLVLER